MTTGSVKLGIQSKMPKNVLLAILAIFSLTEAAKAPVLIWSSSRSMIDMPQSYAGETITDESFKDQYLQHLTSDPQHSVLVFVQDKLSVEDFTNHADVYNPDSDGGAFKNVKSAMDDQFSVHLPAVLDPKSAIEKVAAKFTGDVVRANTPDEVANLKLEDGKNYMIIVSLQPIKAQDEFGSFKKNDEMMGHCMHHLNKRGIKYSAIYTAESSSKMENADSFSGRHLLADEDISGNFTGTFFSENGLLMFLRSITVNIANRKDENNPKTMNETFYFLTASQATTEVPDNATNLLRLTVDFPGNNGTANIEMFIRKDAHGEFIDENGNFSYTPFNDSDLEINQYPIQYKIQATTGFCFHCTLLRTQPIKKKYNGTDIELTLVLNKFQIEAFSNRSNNTEEFSLHVWDCVEFFTGPIWMGIFTTVILMMVLFYGIIMITNITTMDRFDDPKGKTITVTVNE